MGGRYGKEKDKLGAVLFPFVHHHRLASGDLPLSNAGMGNDHRGRDLCCRRCFKKNWTSGAISLIIGIAVLVLGWTAAKIVLLVLGILIAVKGIVALIDACKKSKKNALDLVFPILTIVVGLMLALGNGLDIMIIIVGVLLAIDGAIGLVNALKK